MRSKRHARAEGRWEALHGAHHGRHGAGNRGSRIVAYSNLQEPGFLSQGRMSNPKDEELRTKKIVMIRDGEESDDTCGNGGKHTAEA